MLINAKTCRDFQVRLNTMNALELKKVLTSCFLSPFQFAAPIVHRQDGPAFAGILPEVEQPPEQFTDGVGPPVPNGGVLRRDVGL